MLRVIYGILFICLMLCGFTQTTSILSQKEINDQFSAIQKNYFLRLDLRAPSAFLKSTPDFATRLTYLSDEEHARLKAQPPLSKEEKETAGLIFIYDAMLISNNNIGIEKGIFSLSDFTKELYFSNSRDPKVELKARAEYALSQLEDAKKLRPNDHRLDGWIVGAKTNIELLNTSKISNDTQSKILNMIAARPSFNLWTAILLLHTQDVSQLGGLEKAAKNFVDNTRKGDDPCKDRPEDCLSGPKAPYNLQAAVVELGDVFLRRGEYYLSEKNIPQSMEMAGYAQGTYSVLDDSKNKATTIKWPDYAVIELRKEYLTQVKNKQLPMEPLSKQDLFQRAYECGSCHGRVIDHK